MPDKNLNTRRRIAVGEIKPGMFVISLDQAWPKTPFFFHRKLITSVDEIAALKRNGIREVIIDTTRGIDLDPVRPVDESLSEEDRPPLRSAAVDTLPLKSWRYLP
jgi:cyclic di-GMP phosphodiesterase